MRFWIPFNTESAAAGPFGSQRAACAVTAALRPAKTKAPEGAIARGAVAGEEVGGRCCSPDVVVCDQRSVIVPSCSPIAGSCTYIQPSGCGSSEGTMASGSCVRADPSDRWRAGASGWRSHLPADAIERAGPGHPDRNEPQRPMVGSFARNHR